MLRAELPGIDPEKDVEIALRDGMLSIKAERREEKREGRRSEFHYGTFTRTMRLPAGAVESDVKATYHDGILEVSVPLAEEKMPEPKRIPVVKA